MKKRYFPMFVDLSDQQVVVVGGGEAALVKAQTLLQFTRNVTVIAPKMNLQLLEMGKTGQIQRKLRNVRRADLETAYLVVAASEDWKINYEIYRFCKEEGIYVYVIDNPEECDFFFPEVYTGGNFVAGLYAEDAEPDTVKKVKAEIGKLLVNPDKE